MPRQILLLFLVITTIGCSSNRFGMVCLLVHRGSGKAFATFKVLMICDSAWEIRFRQQSRPKILRIEGTRAGNLRFDGERKELSPGCKPVVGLSPLHQQLMALLP